MIIKPAGMGGLDVHIHIVNGVSAEIAPEIKKVSGPMCSTEL